MKRKAKLWLLFLLCLGALLSCVNLDDVNRRLDEHEKRLTALEASVNKANGEIQTLQRLLDAQSRKVGITSYEALPDNGGYRLVMSDGSIITLLNGSDGTDGMTPLMGFKAGDDGLLYWTINGEFMRDADGNKVRAEGRDGTPGEQGVTPKIRVNSDGYWEMSVDGGTYWTLVTDEGGNPVKAVGQDAQGFEILETEEGLEIHHGDQTFVIPFIKAGFIVADKRYCMADGVDLIELRCLLSNGNTGDAEGADVTANSTFYANDQPLEGNLFATTVPGNYTIRARHANAVIPEIVVEAGTELKATRSLYVELFSAVWCPFCPAGILLLDKLAKHPNVVTASCHPHDRPTQPDPLHYPEATQLYTHYGNRYVPTLVVDRDSTKRVTSSSTMIDRDAPDLVNAERYNGILQYLQGKANLGIALECREEAGNLVVNAWFRTAVNMPNATCVATVCEDGLICNQNNRVLPELGGNPLEDFQHDNVMRAALSSMPLGDGIALTAGTVHEKTYSMLVNDQWNLENLYVVLSLCDANGVALNTRKVKVGQKVGY